MPNKIKHNQLNNLLMQNILTPLNQNHRNLESQDNLSINNQI